MRPLAKCRTATDSAEEEELLAAVPVVVALVVVVVVVVVLVIELTPDPVEIFLASNLALPVDEDVAGGSGFVGMEAVNDSSPPTLKDGRRRFGRRRYIFCFVG
jgi:hypothetical protein